jgi:hypothetical protein
MGQVSSGQKHPVPMSVKELQKQGKAKTHPGTAHMTVKEMMKQ